MKDLKTDWTIYSHDEFQELVLEAKRLNQTNILEEYLDVKGYQKAAYNLYSLQEPQQLIKLTNTPEGLTYQNELNDDDKGQFIDFILNRMLDERRITPLSLDNALPLFPGAVMVALHFEKTGEALPLRQENKPTIKPPNQPKKTRHKGKGL